MLEMKVRLLKSSNHYVDILNHHQSYLSDSAISPDRREGFMSMVTVGTNPEHLLGARYFTIPFDLLNNSGGPIIPICQLKQSQRG